MFVADKVKQAWCSSCSFAGFVDGADKVLEHLDVVAVALVLILGAECELTILLHDLPHAGFRIILFVM